MRSYTSRVRRTRLDFSFGCVQRFTTLITTFLFDVTCIEIVNFVYTLLIRTCIKSSTRLPYVYRFTRIKTIFEGYFLHPIMEYGFDKYICIYIVCVCVYALYTQLV